MVSTWRGGSLTYTVCGYIYSLVSTLDFNLLTPDLSFYVLTKKELHTRKMYNATEQLLHILFAMNAPSCFPPFFPLTLFGVPDTKKSLLNKQWFSTMANRKEKRGGDQNRTSKQKESMPWCSREKMPRPQFNGSRTKQRRRYFSTQKLTSQER